MIVGTETEEEHDELVVEVIRRLEKNDLYVKPEKCKWKVREVGFLGVVIGPKGIKIEKEKVREVLEWLTPKCVKDVQKFLGLANYYLLWQPLITRTNDYTRCNPLSGSIKWGIHKRTRQGVSA